MKRFISLLLAAATALGLSGCGHTSTKPQVSQMKAICELAVMECYYHNVAKYYLEDAEGLLWWKKDKLFWIEYSGVVRLGIDASLVNVSVDDSLVTITIPEASVIDCKVDSASLTEDSFIVDAESADIEAADETMAFSEAQGQLREYAQADTALLTSARQRAQTLLEDYIMNIGAITGQKYEIEWVYIESTDETEPEPTPA